MILCAFSAQSNTSARANTTKYYEIAISRAYYQPKSCPNVFDISKTTPVHPQSYRTCGTIPDFHPACVVTKPSSYRLVSENVPVRA